MKFYFTIPVAILFSIISVYFYADYLEHGDTNAVLMYMVVFSIPILATAGINGILLYFSERKSRIFKVLSAVFIPFIACILIFIGDISIQFIGTITLVSIGITNVFYLALNLDESIWCRMQFTEIIVESVGAS